MKLTAGYCRTSTDKQDISITVQQDKINAMAKIHDITVDRMIKDVGQSAKSLDRPGIQEIITGIEAEEIGTVIISKLDRVTRSVKDLYALIDLFNKHDCRLLSVQESLDTGSASGRLVIGIMGVVSQWEREAIAERTAQALQKNKAEGKAAGPPPFGFCRDLSRPVTRGNKISYPHLIEDKTEQEILYIINYCATRHEATNNYISTYLNGKGYTTRTGRPWTPQGVAHIIKKMEERN